MNGMGKLRIGTLLLVVTLALVPMLGGRNASQAQSSADVEPAWWDILAPNQPGFPVALSGAALSWGSSPTLVDLDGSGTLEVVVAGRDLVSGQPGNGGMVYAYHHNGSLFWEKHVRAPVNSTPSTADLNGDGHPDVVISMGGVPEGYTWHGGVIALNGLTGQELWTFDTQDWLNHRHDGWLDGVFSTPALADVNGDGQLEIAFGAWDQCIYLLDRSGHPLWGSLPGIMVGDYCGGHGYYTEDTIWSSPALADVTGDGRLEIIIGGDASPGNLWGDPGGGYLYILDADGQTLAREWMDQTIYSSPAVADLDNDGSSEFVVGTGTYWSHTGYYVSAFDYDPTPSNPTDRLILKWRQPTGGRVFASPAVADLDKNGGLDVVITSPSGEWGEDGTFVYAWRGVDGALLFKRRACNFMGQSQDSTSSPTVADIDGDTWPEILFDHAWEVTILNHDGTYYSDYSNPAWPGGPMHPGCARDHTPTTELTYWARYSVYGSPAIGDLDGNGRAEIVTVGHNPANPNQGMVFAWTNHSVETWSPWPTWHHDERHTGNSYFEEIPPRNPTSLTSPSHTTRTWSALNQVRMKWSGAVDKESGLAGYSIVWDTSPDTLPNTTRNLEASATSTTSPPLLDGNAHYFHLRTGDQAGNWTANALHFGPFWIDASPPTSRAWSPALVSKPFEVTWSGSDGGSGISHYTIEVRNNDGPWTTWLEDQTRTSATYQGTAGHTYSFRSIAHDKMGHVETESSSSGDSSTIVAEHILTGTVYNQRAQAISGALVIAQPAALNEASTGSEGEYTLGLSASGTYDLTASRSLFGYLPPLKGLAVTGDLANVDFYLPPEPNLIQNGGFEAPGNWLMDSVIQPTRTVGTGHTGDYALQLGTLPESPTASFASSSPSLLGEATNVTDTTTTPSPSTHTWDVGDNSPPSPVTQPTHTDATTATLVLILTATSAVEEDIAAAVVRVYSETQDLETPSTDWTWSISQTASLPDGDLALTLAWLYRVEGQATAEDTLDVTVVGRKSTVNHSLSLAPRPWTHDWIDLSQFAGEEIVVQFALNRKASGEPLIVWLDEISLGVATMIASAYLPIVVRSQ